VFTAWYALSPYIKQIHFVFKGLNQNLWCKSEKWCKFQSRVKAKSSKKKLHKTRPACTCWHLHNVVQGGELLSPDRLTHSYTPFSEAPNCVPAYRSISMLSIISWLGLWAKFWLWTIKRLRPLSIAAHTVHEVIFLHWNTHRSSWTVLWVASHTFMLCRVVTVHYRLVSTCTTCTVDG
jgi:hypothetical protein